MIFLEARASSAFVRWVLDEGAHVIGRDSSCDVVVDDERLSRAHARIHVARRRVTIEDLGSRNGTWVGGAKSERAELDFGQWFAAGTTLFRVRQGVSLTSREPIALEPTKDRARASRMQRTAPVTADAAPRPERTASTVSDADRVHPLDAAAAALESALPWPELSDPLLRTCSAAWGATSAALLVSFGSGWSLVAACGPPLPPEVDGALGGEHDVREVATSNGPALVIAFGNRGRAGRLILHPARQDLVNGAETRLLTALVARAGESCRPNDSRRSGMAGALPEPETERHGFLSVSALSREIVAGIDRVAGTRLSVVLLGETGTGKELLAERIHRASRRTGRFVAVNCAAVPHDLLEAELFGIEKGVATGVSPRAGRFVQAAGGTLFLDEIGDLPSTLQPKLLRALDTGEVTPLGAPSPLHVDVRTIAATHQDLPARARAGRFRLDLYYRLAGIVIRVPPLRERTEDILPLARRFAEQLAQEMGSRFEGLDLDAARLLLAYSWPGNVRELRQVIARALALADGPILHAGLLPDEITGAAGTPESEFALALREDYRGARSRFERAYFRALLDRSRGSRAEAAHLSGLGRTTLYEKLLELGIK